MYLELAWECHYTDDLRAGCSHYVHFLVCKPCSRSFLRFLRRGDQWIIGPAIGLGIPMNASIPRGNQPLDPWSPVPAVLHCFHQIGNIRTLPHIIVGQGFSLLRMAFEARIV